MTALTVFEIAGLCGATVEGEGGRTIVGPASLASAEANQISFLASERYRRELQETRAAAVLVPHGLEVERGEVTLLRCEDPQRAFTAVVAAFAEPVERPAPGIHPTAVVDPRAEVHAEASVGALCVVGPGTRIGARSALHPRVVVGAECELGEDCELHPGVVLYPRVRLGARCILHAGAILGAEGFGFDPTPEGWVKVPQCGTVVLEDDVEVGANSCIDRARFSATRIGRGTKIDNLTQVGHNVQVGHDSLLCAQVGVSGSTRLGSWVVMGGQSGANGHVEIGDRARIAGGSGVYATLEGGADYGGTPSRPLREHLRTAASLSKLPRLLERLRGLERRLRELEERGR